MKQRPDEDWFPLHAVCHTSLVNRFGMCRMAFVLTINCCSFSVLSGEFDELFGTHS